MTKEPRRKSIGAARNPASAEAILNAAEQVLIEKGYKGFTIDEVARRAKAGKPTIYKWWPNKAVLLLDVYMRQKSIIFQNTGKFEDDLVAFIDAIFTNWRETPTGPIFRSIIAEAQSDEASREAVSKFATDRQAETSFLILQGLKRGDVRDSVDPIRVARWIGAYLWYQLLTGNLDHTTADIRDDVEILLMGLANGTQS
ncbi:AcrR family transcriptional regulator [Yoonia maritima]|uniref:AcrR family transcriptional regulator n=1 Tax=Yoonia maritima TaxID=1435347 RepID=A0A2T0VX98_9RHOB|nr:TetR/AcrR family transcriptional regulator [Yoonia maritima]PRY76652.1 AcrR family transcriptional regulator [Yoonia maritima]